ncbi:hypothetical protein [Sphingopyxis sp. PET50]|uniref:hypothetical protein n=1 Tax=Sphingopyxis sp. PET50 TaxID=2976533 RepID=UPI00391B51B8
MRTSPEPCGERLGLRARDVERDAVGTGKQQRRSARDQIVEADRDVAARNLDRADIARQNRRSVALSDDRKSVARSMMRLCRRAGRLVQSLSENIQGHLRVITMNRLLGMARQAAVKREG